MSERSAATHSAPDATKAATGEQPTRSPPTAGPTMVAIGLPAELTTIARDEPPLDQRRRQTRARRRIEGARAAEQGRDAVDRPEKGEPAIGHRAEQGGRAELDAKPRHHGLAPVINVGGVAGEQGQGEHRQELGEAQHAERQPAWLTGKVWRATA